MCAANSSTHDILINAMITSLKNNGTISAKMLADTVNSTTATPDAAQESPPKMDDDVRSEVRKLAHYISAAKQEIVSIVPEDPDSDFFDNAGEELNAVVQATEDATNAILDATDEIIAASQPIEDNALKQSITAATTRIYDASNFQDITGQRINKVIKTLEYVEVKVAKLATMFGTDDETLRKIATKDIDARIKDTRPDAELMEGPQLPGQGTSQEDIDAMFGS